MTSDSASGGRLAPAILCAGIIVLDEVFQVESFPPPDGKSAGASGFFVVNGGCAANAAVAIARLGGRAALAGPLGGPAGEDANGDRVLAALAREQVDCSGCQRVPGMATALSAIFIDARGDRMIVTYRDDRIAAATPTDPAGLVACADARARRQPVSRIRAADLRGGARARHHRGARRRPADASVRRAVPDRHPRGVFERVPARHHRSRRPRRRARRASPATTRAFLAVTNGPDDVLWLEGTRRCSGARSSPSQAVDTLGAGDVFHGAFTLALAEGRDARRAPCDLPLPRPGSNARALGGSAGAPTRDEVDALLARSQPAAASKP